MGRGKLLQDPHKYLCRLCIGLAIISLVAVAHAGNVSTKPPTSGDAQSAEAVQDSDDGYGDIDEFLVFDTKFTYRLPKNFTASLGVDNLTDESYHVSHPYPRRTYLAELKWNF